MNEESHSIFGSGDADSPPSRFAPAQRATREDVEASLYSLVGQRILPILFSSAGALLVVLNRERQILFATEDLMRMLGSKHVEELLGQRTGEALRCVHAWEGPSGCGTSDVCSSCGAVIAILKSQEGEEPVERDCTITVERDGRLEAREFRVKAAPLRVGDETFTFVSLRDVSDEKRREVLERVFFHDLLNTVSGLEAWAQILRVAGEEKREMAARRISFLAARLRREIDDQQALVRAEQGTLVLDLAPVPPGRILETVEGTFSGHEAASGRLLEVVREPGGGEIVTDASIVVRVLNNMVKNALEATRRGGSVRLASRVDGETCRFEVWNEGEIPRQTAAQIFKRSFSTKAGRGRGLGTFSMRLLGEGYLGGKVGFATSEGEGTVFFLELPRGGPTASIASARA